MKGTTNRVIVDWRASPRGSELKPAVVVKDDKGKPIKVARGGDARYLLAVDSILSVEPGAKVKAGDVLARIPLASAKSGDITGGLPRVAELFEARRPKDHAIIAEISGTVEFGKDYKNKQRINIKPDDDTQETVEYLIPRGKSLAVQHGDRIERGDFVYDGHPAPHDILAIKGVEELANYLINEIQDVYRLQGVTINDKHIEVIVRQMLQKVEIIDPGDTDLIKSEQIDRIEFDEKNAEVEKLGKRRATSNPVLLGITKASLQTKSFISAASFQETTRVLTDAAVNGKADMLEGLKENVIVGRLIPAGTGGMLRRVRKIAAKRDEMIAKENAKGSDAALSAPEAPARRRRRPTEEIVEQ
jgi:DNA-directed RNA polymerase subunit beta'